MLARLLAMPFLIPDMLPAALSKPSMLADIRSGTLTDIRSSSLQDVQPSTLAYVQPGALDAHPSMLADLPRDSLMIVLSNLDLVSLYDAATVSGGFRGVLLPILQSLYGIGCNGRIYLYYSTILCKFEALQVLAFEGRAAAEARAVLQGFPEYMAIKAVLEAEFGFCIRRADERLRFALERGLLDMLLNDKKASALPYLLDQDPYISEWIYCIRSLVDLGRLDLLDLLRFPNIEEDHFYLLLSIPLPAPVMLAAARSLHRRRPELAVSKLIAFAVLQEEDACVPDGPVPLFILQHMHENRISIPQDWVFTDGLLERSISFWMYLLGKEPGEAWELLDAIVEHGDAHTKCLVNVFDQVVSSHDMPAGAEDVYQAMLVRFHCSLHCTAYVWENYTSMTVGPLKIGYHSMHALLGCGKSELIAWFELCCDSQGALEALLVKMHRLGDMNLPLVVQRYLEQHCRAPYLLRTLIRQSASDWYIQLVWNWIQAKSAFSETAECCCIAPVCSLQRLVACGDISVEAVEEILSNVHAYQGSAAMIPREVVNLYTVMFWEAPEKVIVHFIDQLAVDCRLDFEIVHDFSFSTKYSIGLWRRLVKHSQAMKGYWSIRLEFFRPDLLGLFKEGLGPAQNDD